MAQAKNPSTGAKSDNSPGRQQRAAASSNPKDSLITSAERKKRKGASLSALRPLQAYVSILQLVGFTYRGLH